MNSLFNRLVNLFRQRSLLAIFLMIFIADLVSGIFYSTFSLYAASLGASVTLIGLLGSVVGLTRILTSVPIGLLSDHHGRRVVLLSGMILFAVASFLYAYNVNPYWLVPIRVLSGIVITATFFIGMAYVGDIVSPADQGLVSGVYTTFMGLGFSLGSVLGGFLAADYGYRTTYIVAGFVALAGFFVGWRWLAQSAARAAATDKPGPSTREKLSLLARDPRLLAASLGNLFVLVLFDAAIVSFFPLYAGALLISQATVGTIFGLRALASAFVRLPTGILSTRIRSDRVMITAMIIGAVSVFSITFVSDPWILALLLIGEGICYGMFLTSGQAFINENFPIADRGTAMGIFSMTGSIGSMAGPFLLGAAANFLGLRSAFWLSALMMTAGIILFILVNAGNLRRADARAPQPGR